MATPTTQRTTDADPFNITPNSNNRDRTKPLRHSQIDSQLLTPFARGSPSQAKRAVEAHIVDTDRRIHDATKLGSTLLDQKKQLAERLDDLEAQQEDDEISTDLKLKLTELEKDYNEVGRDTARAFIPRGKRASLDLGSGDVERTPLADKGSNANYQRPESPEKLGKSSTRKSRNQSQNRVHDIEFATEISTSLLGQVRGLQNLLAEKEDALKKVQKENSQLQSDFETLAQRMKGLDDQEEKFKDENWNLETQVQDLTALIKEAAVREEKLQQSLSTAKQEKSASDREYEELRQQHGKLTDDHTALRKSHDGHLAESKRNLEDGQKEKDEMQKRIDELYSQNQDLAKAVAYKAKAEQEDAERELEEEDDDVVESIELGTPETSPPPSPTKATPRHGALESETLKSSLHHAHRMIQTLKNNIHREKTEKIELKRMLQDARDDIEQQKVGGGAAGANAGRKRKPASGQDPFKKPARPSKLGGARSTSEWEDYEGSPSRKVSAAREADLTTDASDAFETADEKNADSQTDTDAAFESAADTMAASTDDDDELTETEDNFKNTIPTSLGRTPILKRGSFQSTASDEEDAFDPNTPLSRQPKYKLKLNRGGIRRSETPLTDSPASFVSNQSLPRSGQNLASELEGMDSASSAATSRATTVERSPEPVTGTPYTPDIHRRDTTIRSPMPSIPPKPVYVDSSMLTDPWEPEPKREQNEPAVGLDVSNTKEASTQSTPKKAGPAMPLQISNIATQSTTPMAPSKPIPIKSHADAATMMTPETNRTLPFTTSDEDDEFVPPALASIGKDNKLAPSTQKFLNDILAQARQKRAETAAARAARADTSTPTTSKSAGADITAERERSPSFAISIPGRDMKQNEAPAPVTPDGKVINEPRLSIQESERKEDGTFKEPTLAINDAQSAGAQSPVYDLGLSPSFSRTANGGPRAKVPLERVSMVNSSTQTTMLGEQIDTMIKDRQRPSSTNGLNTTPVSRGSPANGRAMSMGTSTDPSLIKTLGKRPTSSGSMRNRTSSPPPTGEAVPPLPADHREVIAEAKTRTSSLMSMPPPNLATSKISTPSQPRDRSSSALTQSPLRGPNPPRNRTSSIAARSEVSRRSSISSFASEIDERFNINRYSGLSAYGDIPGSGNADPRMIQAITQTMIGEFLWKYTRKAGRGDSHSENRHRRFFWIHPYTRTLYWSNSDPSVAGRSEIKAKSVAIEAVRVVGDDNPIPPGLCNKSIVIVTPGRSIKFTAPTQRRHETWFNALSYLLLRNAPEREGDVVTNPYDRSNTTSSAITADDVAEFNPNTYSRAASRISHRSVSSLGTSGRKSIPARNSYRTSSPQGRSTAGGVTNSLAIRQSQAALKREQMRGQPDPLNANPVTPSNVAPIPESDTSRRGSGTGPDLPNDHLEESAIYDSPTKDGKVDTAVQAGESQLEIDADGFKKPKVRPISTTTVQSNLSSTKAESFKDAGEGTANEGAKTGRISSITSRISRASFASIGRGRRATKSEVEMKPNGAAHGHGSAADGHEHQYVFRRNEDGTLENVRACCDGKHDLSTLRNRSESRVSLGRKRSQSQTANGRKRMSFSQRVAPRPAGGT